MWCDCVTVWHLWRDTFPHFLLCSKSKIKRKEKKRNIDNDLAVFAKSWQKAEERSSRKGRWRKCTWEQDSSRLPSLPMACQKARSLTIVWGRVPGVGLGWRRVVSQCSGGVLYHHYGLARFRNPEVFFVSLSLLSLCFVIIIKYSRAQKGTQASYLHHYPSLLL